jgi:hypothetical protein
MNAAAPFTMALAKLKVNSTFRVKQIIDSTKHANEKVCGYKHLRCYPIEKGNIFADRVQISATVCDSDGHAGRPEPGRSARR